MKNLTCLLVIGGMCSSAIATAITQTSSGGVDPLVASARISPSHPGHEQDWVASAIGEEFGAGSTSDGWGWSVLDGTSAYALSMDPEVPYFLVKTGTGHPLGHTHFLYRNEGNPAYAVIDLTELGGDPNKVDVSKIRHYTQYRPVAVPEPSSLVLLGVGLLGLSLAASRSRSRRWQSGANRPLRSEPCS